MNKILLITNYFPLKSSGENIFLKEEYNYCKPYFEIKQKLIPSSTLFPKRKYNLFIHFISFVKFFKIIVFGFQNIRRQHILYDLRQILRIIRIIDGLNSITVKYKNVYTYWNDEYTLTLILLKKFYKPELKIVSRIHGIDYIEERQQIPPFLRKLVFTNLDLIISQCKWSKEYIEKKYDLQLNNFFDIPIGVQNFNKPHRNLCDTTLNIASCSNLIELKNVDLHIKLLSQVALRNANNLFHYFIIGSGPESENLKKACAFLPTNLKITFVGNLDNNVIQNFYEENRISLLIHLSKHEGGIPLAIQEGLSQGLRIIISKQECLNDLIDVSPGICVIDLNTEEKTQIKKIEAMIFYESKIVFEQEKKNIEIASVKFNAKKNSSILFYKLDEIFNNLK